MFHLQRVREFVDPREDSSLAVEKLRPVSIWNLPGLSCWGSSLVLLVGKLGFCGPEAQARETTGNRAHIS